MHGMTCRSTGVLIIALTQDASQDTSNYCNNNCSCVENVGNVDPQSNLAIGLG